MKTMIKFIGATLAGLIVFVVLVAAWNGITWFLGMGKYPDFVFGSISWIVFWWVASLFIGGVVAGFLLPASANPNLYSIIFSPGLWIAVWLLVRPDTQSMSIKEMLLRMTMKLILPCLISWGACRLGVFVRERTFGKNKMKDCEQCTPGYRL